MLDLVEFSQRLKLVNTITDGVRLAESFARANGAVMGGFHHLAPIGASDRTEHLTLHAFGFPDEWVEYYIKEGGHKHDPIPQTVIRRSMPLWWSEIAASTRAKSSARDYLVRLRQTILGDGIAITVFGPAGRNGYVGLGFGSGARVPPERQILTSQLGMQLAHLRYCQVVAAMNVPTTLSARETQVVLLMAHGSTNKEIAEHLNISRSSVDTYIGRLFAKLDVQERTGAVLRAAALGLLA